MGHNAGVRVVCIHGFTQSAASWDAVRRALPATVEVAALDVPERASFAETAVALGAAGGAGCYVGYSMGGRLALRLALDRPDLVRVLVLLGASPGLADPEDRAVRRAADEDLARAVERDGVDAFLDRWLAQPLFATLPRDAAGLGERRRVNTVSRLVHQLRVLGVGTQEPLWDRLAELRMPVVAVAGELDTKYAGIAREMAAAIGPPAVVRLVAGAGHAAHLERPDAVARVIEDAVPAEPG